MNNVPVYTQYNDETKIALLDNSSIAFLEKMERGNWIVLKKNGGIGCL